MRLTQPIALILLSTLATCSPVPQQGVALSPPPPPSDAPTASIWAAPSCSAPAAASSVEPPRGRRVPENETFRFSDVKVAAVKDGTQLSVSYKVENLSDQRRRGRACLEILDDQGFILDEKVFGEFSLRPGDFDELVEVESIDPGGTEHVWAQAHLLRLSVIPMNGVSCIVGDNAAKKTLSPAMFLDINGRLASAPASVKPKDVEGEMNVRLEQVQFRRDSDGPRIKLKITNTSTGRASGSICVRLFDASQCQCNPIDSAQVADYNLGPGKSTEQDDSLTFEHDGSWDKAKTIRLYASQFGCANPVQDATSQVISMGRPALRIGAAAP